MNDICVKPFKMLGKFPFSTSHELLERLKLIWTRLNLRFLAQEPMLAAITLYMSVIYGILYLNFVA